MQNSTKAFKEEYYSESPYQKWPTDATPTLTFPVIFRPSSVETAVLKL